MKNGIILYEGASLITHEPIAAIAVGIHRPSVNTKTGPMVSVFILVKDHHPMEAASTGLDAAICGDCRHRGRIVTMEDGKSKNVERSCYVRLMNGGPGSVYRAYKAGDYLTAPLEVAQATLAGRMVRIGAYGDPAAVPIDVWRTSLASAAGVTGYTHLWQQYPELRAFCMASCDTEQERMKAKALGFRTFRVRTRDDPLMVGEGHCPGSAEMGHAAICYTCRLCGGQTTPAKADISIQIHGVGAKHFDKEFA